MLPDSLLLHSLVGDEVVPHYLAANDQPWIRSLLDEYDRYVGRPRRELEERLREPLLMAGPYAKQRLAVHVLLRLAATRCPAPLPPRRLRAALTTAAARSTLCREAVLGEVAASLGLSSRQVEDFLYADLPGERLVADFPLSPGELTLRTNLALAQGFLFRASEVVLSASGNARALVRQAALYGLIVTIRRAPDADACLEISGPLSLFHRTLIYGRALSALVPILPWCPRFTLQARCVLKGETRSFSLRPTDPVFPSAEPRRYDSRLEERFARDFARLAKDWNLLREPQAVDAGDALIFPDFAVEHATQPGRRWLLEIVGFWTPDYLEKKLTRLRAAGLDRLILCVDQDRACAEGELPAGARLVRFRRRIDATAILQIIEGA